MRLSSERPSETAYTCYKEGCNYAEMGEKENMYTLRLELYYDDFGTASAISHANARCKVGAFYLTLNNLPYWAQSKRKSILLCLVILTSTIQQTSIKTVLQPLLNELQTLSHGIDLGLRFNVTGYIAAVIGDNKATNELAGLTTCFTSSCCKYCTGHYSFWQEPKVCLSLPEDRNSRCEYRQYKRPFDSAHAFLDVDHPRLPYTFDIFHDLHEGNI